MYTRRLLPPGPLPALRSGAAPRTKMSLGKGNFASLDFAFLLHNVCDSFAENRRDFGKPWSKMTLGMSEPAVVIIVIETIMMLMVIVIVTVKMITLASKMALGI